jgi:predicted membrane protein (TIGR00267 family)
MAEISKPVSPPSSEPEPVAPGVSVRGAPAAPRPPDLTLFEHHRQDEADAVFLYRQLSASEADPHKKDLYRRLAEVEERHTAVWTDLLAAHGRPPRSPRPSLRARMLALAGRTFGPRFLLPLLLAEEGREVRGYFQMHRDTPAGVAGRQEALLLARESADHATTLGQVAGRAGEPWHRAESGGFLRNVVYGFNDGLTANFGLVAGVLGATAAQQHRAVVVAGVAGLIADALSMGSSGYLAAKSEREVYTHEIDMELTEIELMPEVERDELALLYEAKGMEREAARALATEVMADPVRMLDEQVKEELKIGDQTSSPFREGWLTGLATAVGALIPVLPFVLVQGRTAIVLSFTIAMASHFLVGAARSVFTGRGVIRSGFDMFIVGMGIAAIGYYLGEWIAKLF